MDQLFLWQTNDALDAGYFLSLDLWKDSTNQTEDINAYEIQIFSQGKRA